MIWYAVAFLAGGLSWWVFGDRIGTFKHFRDGMNDTRDKTEIARITDRCFEHAERELPSQWVAVLFVSSGDSTCSAHNGASDDGVMRGLKFIVGEYEKKNGAIALDAPDDDQRLPT
jgi:hypothetical protein